MINDLHIVSWIEDFIVDYGKIVFPLSQETSIKLWYNFI